MPTLCIRFPGGRYHATPWGHHVNEGLVEWPPSPWRLMRALLAIGYTAGIWGDEGPDETGKALFEKLACVLPTYFLPQASGAHTRHYMPIGVLDKGKEKTTMVFDTWARVGDGEMTVTWDVALTETETVLLADLAAKLGYLGRSESWVTVRLAQPGEPLPTSNCMPSNTSPLPGWEQVPLLAPLSISGYSEWRVHALETLRTRPDAYPDDLLACLQMTTAKLRKFGWSQPPGSQRVFYARKSNALEVAPPRAARRVQAAPVEAMLLSLAASTGNNHALPPVSRTVPQAERLHMQLVGHLNGVNNPALTGCTENGEPLREPHQHAHLLPLDLDNDGRLDHVLVWAPMGLDHTAQQAVRAVRRTFAKGVDALRVALSASGSIDGMRLLPGTYGDGLRSVIGTAQGACVWESRTPFIPPRFLKKNGKNSLIGQVMAELASRGLPEPVEITLLDPREHDGARKQRHFIRSRKNGPPAPIDCSFSLSLRFDQPQVGPICLGYGCHYGLGLFAPMSD